MASVDIAGVRKAYGEAYVVHGVDISVRDGEFVVLIGPSGCGKSTLLRMIAGLESITDGTIRIGDRVVNDLPPRDRDIAMVFQDYALYPHKTVAENIGFPLKMRGADQVAIDKKVADAAQILQIGHLLDRKPGQLSGGQRQRVAMGRAIVRDPKVFLFDEPLSNLDAQLRGEMRIEIKKLHQRFGTTILYVTHDQIEAMTLADRIAILKDGHLQQFDAPDSLYSRPASAFVGGFIGSPQMNFIDVALSGDDLILPGSARIAVPPQALARLAAMGGRPARLGIRPEHVEPAASGAPGAMTGHIVLVEPLGSDTHALIRVGDAEFTARFAPDMRLIAGDAVNISFNFAKAHLFDSQTGRAIA